MRATTHAQIALAPGCWLATRRAWSASIAMLNALLPSSALLGCGSTASDPVDGAAGAGVDGRTSDSTTLENAAATNTTGSATSGDSSGGSGARAGNSGGSDTGGAASSGGGDTGSAASDAGGGGAPPDDGTRCVPSGAFCRALPPECPDSEVPAIEGSCWGDCVPVEQCGCAGPEDCPDRARFTCLSARGHCAPYL